MIKDSILIELNFTHMDSPTEKVSYTGATLLKRKKKFLHSHHTLTSNFIPEIIDSWVVVYKDFSPWASDYDGPGLQMNIYKLKEWSDKHHAGADTNGLLNYWLKIAF